MVKKKYLYGLHLWLPKAQAPVASFQLPEALEEIDSKESRKGLC